MHEFSLCEGILKQVSRANKNTLNNITQINLEIGKLAGVDLDSLLFWFPVVTEKLLCPQIKLKVNNLDGKAICKQCQQEFNIINLYDPCPNCNAFGNYRIISGRELLVKSFEIVSQ